MKLTKLEKFVNDNPNMSFADMATQLNRTISTMERAYDRLEKKRKGIDTHVCACPRDLSRATKPCPIHPGVCL